MIVHHWPVWIVMRHSYEDAWVTGLFWTEAEAKAFVKDANDEVVKSSIPRRGPTPPEKYTICCRRCSGHMLPVEWGCPECGPEP